MLRAHAYHKQTAARFFAQSPHLFHFHFPVLTQVGFGGYYDLLGSVLAIFGNVLQPVLKVVKWGGIGDIEGDDESLRASIVGLGDGVEAFLASSVPNLQLSFSFIESHDLFSEVDADGRDVGLREVVVNVFADEWGLAYSCVANHQYFENQLVITLDDEGGFLHLLLLAFTHSL